jgi:hypothetical protein
MDLIENVPDPDQQDLNTVHLSLNHPLLAAEAQQQTDRSATKHTAPRKFTDHRRYSPYETEAARRKRAYRDKLKYQRRQNRLVLKPDANIIDEFKSPSDIELENAIQSQSSQDESEDHHLLPPSPVLINNNNDGNRRTTFEFDENNQLLGSKSTKDKSKPPIVEPWIGIPLRASLFPEELESEKSANPRYCFLCDYSPTRLALTENDRYEELCTFFHENYGRVDKAWLLAETQMLYNKTLRKFTDENLPWYKQQIEDHFTVHCPTTRYMLELQFQTLNDILRVLEKHNILETKSTSSEDTATAASVSKIRINLQYAELYFKICDKMRPMLKVLTQMRPAISGASGNSHK